MTRRIAAGNVTAKQACNWAELDYDTYLKLVRDHCLAHTPAGGVDLNYFIALFVFARLADRLGFETVRQVWPQVKEDIPPQDEANSEILKLFVGIPMPTACLIRSAAELAQIMSDEGGGRLLEVRSHIQKSRAFFLDRLPKPREGASEPRLRVVIERHG